MKNKVVILFVLIFVFAPLASFAMVVTPVEINVVVNTQGSDNTFAFKLQYLEQECVDVDEYDEQGEWVDWHEECSDIWKDKEDFSLQTENLTAQKNFPNISPAGQQKIYEEVPAGYNLDSIVCLSDNPNNAFVYQPDGAIIANLQFGSSITCSFNNVKTKTPVLIVPGLTGTELKRGDELLWFDPLKMLSDIGDEFMDPLSFSADLFPSDSNISLLDIIRQKTFLKKFDYSEGLINEFENQGYVENETLFTFPYDWRYGVSGKYADGSTNSDLLAQKIESILQQTKAEKVDVIAHSMGGLIVKKYVFDTAASAQGSGVPKIGKAVFAGVPNTGAPKAVKSLISGDNFGIPWLSEKEMKKISKNMPAGYDLLPSQQYYNAKGSFVQIINEINLTTENLSEQNTTKDLNYEETKSFLINDHGLNLQAEENAESLHAADFDNFDLRTAGIDLYSINGCKAGTFSKIIENRFENGLGATVVSYKAPQFSPGDGTVPLESATNLPISDSNKFYSLTGDHGKMLSQDGTRQEIVNLIAGSNLSTGSNLITQDIAQCNLNGKAISVFSPVNIFVTDQDGNKMGLADDESIINEIPNASFEILGERKFIYLPTDNGQVYTISLTGTGEGTFTIKSEDIQNSQTTKTEVFSNLPVTLEMTGSVNINLADNSTNLNIKQSETSDEQIILASFVLDEEQSKDLLPPMSVATLAGELEAPGVYKSSVEISVKATDENSGVFSLHYNLDNLGLVDFLGSSLVETVSLTGSHVFKFFSTDNAGNNEQEKTINFEIILPPEPEPEPEPEPQITPSVLPLPSGGGAGGGGGNNYLPVETVQPPLSLEPTEPALITHNNESEKIPEAREVLVYDVQTQIPAPVATKALQIEKPEKQEIVLQGISQPIATAGLSANKNFLQYILDWFLKIWNKLLNVVK